MNRSLDYTHHAWQRKNERCKSDTLVNALLAHFDRDIYLGRGLWAWTLSRQRCRELQDEGLIPAAIAERLTGIALVVSDEEDVVTLVRGCDNEFGQYCSRH